MIWRMMSFELFSVVSWSPLQTEGVNQHHKFHQTTKKEVKIERENRETKKPRKKPTTRSLRNSSLVQRHKQHLFLHSPQRQVCINRCYCTLQDPSYIFRLTCEENFELRKRQTQQELQRTFVLLNATITANALFINESRHQLLKGTWNNETWLSSTLEKLKKR
jgi:hypothetical protein